MGKDKVTLRFGTGGVPHSAPSPDPLSGVEQVAALGLSAMELEFVYGVRIRDDTAEKIRVRAEELGIALTCHGPYYINLNAVEPEKRQASVERILATARAARKVGARAITFHAAFYLKQEPTSVHQTVHEALARIEETLAAEGNEVQIRPELTGKPSQYGNLEELLLLSQEIPRVRPCVDFSHLHARSGGAMNSLEEFRAVLTHYRAALGKQSLGDLHLHISGINYTAKGERRHLDLGEADLCYRELLQALVEEDAGGIVICESPNLEDDAKLLQSTYQNLLKQRDAVGP
jgi:deoxyribonuclease-4